MKQGEKENGEEFLVCSMLCSVQEHSELLMKETLIAVHCFGVI